MQIKMVRRQIVSRDQTDNLDHTDLYQSMLMSRVSQLKFEDRGCTPVSSTDRIFNYMTLFLDDEPMLIANRKIDSPDWRLYVTIMEFAPGYDFLTMNHAHQLLAHANESRS